MRVQTKRRLIALMIGLGTVAAGLFAWRAGQIGSGANFDDRQSISQQVDEETVRIDVAVEATRQARQYDRYVADYLVAEGLDDDAARLREVGATELALVAESDADARRAAATDRAYASGVFDRATLTNSAQVTEEPRPFDLQERLEQLYVEQTTGLTSQGDLDPQHWADESDAARVRVRLLIQWVAVLLASVAVLTTAQVTVSHRVRLVAVPLGVALLATGLVGGLTNGFFA